MGGSITFRGIPGQQTTRTGKVRLVAPCINTIRYVSVPHIAEQASSMIATCAQSGPSSVDREQGLPAWTNLQDGTSEV
eukprot:1347911-Rhodomonas_salina.2